MAGTTVVNLYDELRARWLWRPLDAFLTAPIAHTVPNAPVSELVRAASPTYRRAQHFLNAVTRWLPSSIELCRRRLWQPGRLPFAAEDVSLISFGSGTTVFLLQSPGQAKHDARVLKVKRKTLGKRLEAQLQFVKDARAKYDRVQGWYDGCSIVLPAEFLILHGPLLSGAAVCCVQPYVGCDYVDVLHDLSEAELLQLLRRHPRLQAQFRLFVERTVSAAKKDGACIDLLGRNNVVVTRDGKEPRLVLLDNGIYEFRSKMKESPAALAVLSNMLMYLQRVCAQLPVSAAAESKAAADSGYPQRLYALAFVACSMTDQPLSVA